MMSDLAQNKGVVDPKAQATVADVAMLACHVPDADQIFASSTGESKGKRRVGMAQRRTFEMPVIQLLLGRMDQDTNDRELFRMQ
jgi:hypothetical protein